MEKNEQIRWQTWTPEVFARSREEGKLIFLSISATWCHWCHVMDSESFDHPEVIRRLNRDFIPVRVDSDKRPDINSRYNMGGWPSVALLDAEGGVTTGGTFMPISQLLDMISRFYPKGTHAAPKPFPTPPKISAPELRPDPEAVREVLAWVEKAFDPHFGGFGPPPKFPQAWILELILKNRDRVEDPKWRNIASLTLDAMRGSELYDHEDGGFFRYATLSDWDRPHFEKLLETNAKMLSIYVEAYRVLGEQTYLFTARGILDYLRTFLVDSESPAFFGSQSADETYYRLSENVRLHSLPPPVDKTLYADLNAETASAFLKAGSVFPDPDLSSSGIRLTDFLWEKFYNREFGMTHCAGGTLPLRGFLSDQVRMVTLLLDALEMEGEKRFLERALTLLEWMNRNLWDEEAEGFRDLPRQSSSKEGLLKKEMKPLVENSLAAMVLTRLFLVTGNEDFKSQAERTLSFLSSIFKPYKHHAAVFALALERFLVPPDSIVVIGDRENEKWGRLVKAAHRMNSLKTPCWKVVNPLDNKDDSGRIEKLGYRPSDKPSAYLCRGRTCLPPVYDPEELEALVVPDIQ